MAGSRRRALSSLVAFALLAPAVAPALADDTVYKRTTPVKVDVTISERSRPPGPKVTAAPPPLTAADALAIRGKVVPIHKQQIELYRQLIASTPAADVDDLADAHFRLADLYLQDNRYHRLKATEATIAADRARGADRATLARAAKTHRAEAAAELREALAVFAALAADARFRTYPRMDEALFGFGFALAQSGDGAQARVIYQRLLQDHPQSRYVPDAYVAFADYYFGVDELENAAVFYQKVLQFPQAAMFDYANYRLGWVFLNQRRPEDAGRQFAQVVRDTAGDAAQATLHAAALNDFVRAYADFGQVGKAWAAFGKLDADRAPTMYASLAALYLDQGKSDKAIFALRQLLTAAPGHADVCRWQADVARATLALPGATLDDKAAEIARLAALWGALRKTTQLPADARTDCRDDAAAMAGELARAWHSEGVKTKDPAVLAAADRLYGAYLAEFADAADAGEAGYYRAELAWVRADWERDARRQTARWQEAGAAFTAVVKGGRVTPALIKESADAAVRAWKNALDVDPRPKLAAAVTAAGKVPPPTPIPDPERALLGAMADYATYVKDPRDPERIGMTFLQAEVYRRFHHYDEAIPRYVDLIEHHPGHETAYYAANLLLNLLVETGQTDQIVRWTGYFAAHPEFLAAGGDQDRGELGRRVAEYEVIAGRERAERLEREARARGDLATFVACGAAYLDLFNRNPEAAKADELLWNAGLCFEQGRSLSTAIEAFTELRARFPASPQAAKALARLGAVYAQVAYYDRAAGMFEEYAKKYAGMGDAYDLMSDAVFYRKGAGQDDLAIADTTYFIKTFARRQPAVAAAAFFGLGAIYEKRGDRDAIVAHYRAYLQRHRDHGGADKVIAAQARIGQVLWEASCPVATVDGACVKVHRERAVATRGRRLDVGVRTQCGPPTKIKVTVVPRDPAKVKQSQAAFAAAIAAYEAHAGALGAEAKAARYWYAQARFHQAEVEYEAFLAMKFPAGLDFDPAKPAVAARSLRRFEAWYGAKDKLSATIGARYAALVKQVQDPATAIAAAARFGQVQQNFADALYTAEVPAQLRPYEEAVDAYCETLEAEAAPHTDASLLGFEKCLQASTDFGWFSSWSTLCERELGQLRPERFPTAAELRAAPDAAIAVADVEPVVARLE